MKHAYAYAFTSPVPPGAMFDRLRTAGDWRWIDGARAHRGDYLVTTSVQGAVIEVAADEPEPGRCAVRVRFESDEPAADALDLACRVALIGTILPAVEARDIHRLDPGA